jgi:hypothetical protein
LISRKVAAPGHLVFFYFLSLFGLNTLGFECGYDFGVRLPTALAVDLLIPGEDDEFVGDESGESR